MNEPKWLTLAREFIGVEELRGKHHNPIITGMLQEMGSFNGEFKSWWSDDETPWCGLFVGYILGLSKRHVVKEWYRAKSWESPAEMTQLKQPALGCIVTFNRVGGGHVGFIVGKDKKENLMVLGGNQNNQVKISPFAPERATGFFWPSYRGPLKSSPYNSRYELPTIKSNGKLSTNEA